MRFSTIWQQITYVYPQPIPAMHRWDRLYHALCAVSAGLFLVLVMQSPEIVIDGQRAIPLWWLLVPLQTVVIIFVAIWGYWYVPWQSTSIMDQRLGGVAATVCIVSICTAPTGLLAIANTSDVMYRMALVGLHLQQLWFIRRGYVRIGIAYLISAYIIFTLATESTILVSFTVGFMMTVFISGLLIRGWAGIAISLVLPLTQMLCQIIGLIPGGVNWNLTMGLIFVYLLISIIIAQYANSLEAALAGESARSAELAQSQQEVKESTTALIATQQRWTAELEHTVAQRTQELEAANAQLRTFSAQAADLAVEQERIRLAREIHDGLGQYLDALTLYLGIAEESLDRPERARKNLQIASTQAQGVRQEVRRAINALLTDQAAASLEALLLPDIHICRLGAIAVDIDVRGAVRSMPASIQHTLYRITQEALNNVRRHAYATHTQITLDYCDPNRIRLIVSDNGQGFDLQQSPTGRGLTNLRERATLIGGTIDIQTILGSGVTITVEVPICNTPSVS